MGSLEAFRSAESRARLVPARPLVVAGLVVALLVVSFIRQRQLLDQGGPVGIFVWLAVLGILAGGLLAFGTPTLVDYCSWPGRSESAIRFSAPRTSLVAGSLVAAGLAAWLVHTGGSPTVATIAWVAGLALIVAAATDADALVGLRSVPAWLRAIDLQQAWPAVTLITILIAAMALRLPALDSIPGYIHNDEASNGLMARSVATGQVPSLFGYGWASLPIMGYAWDGLFFKLLGDSLTSLRLSSAVLGVASIAVTALLGKELFSWRVGLIAATLLTFFHMHIHFSRVGHHYIQALFAVTLTLYLLTLALRYGWPLAAVGAGMLISVDIQVYYAARVAYVIVPLAILYVLLVSDRHLLRSRISTVSWMILGWIVGVAPIGAFILGDWSDFLARTRDVLVLGDSARGHVVSVYGTHDTRVILENQIWRVTQTFNFSGDTSEQYGSSYPMLDPVDASLFPAAVAYGIFRIRHAGFAICLIALISIAVVGGVLTIDPAFWPRLIVILPILALLLAALIDAIWQLLDRIPRATIPTILAACAILVVVAHDNYQWYFNDFETRIHANFLAAPMDIGNYLRPIHDHPIVYGITDGGLYVDHEAIRLLAPDAQTCNVLQGIDIRQCPPPSIPTKDRIFIVMPARKSLLPDLQHAYPGGTLQVLRTYDTGAKIYSYRVVS